MSFILAAAPGPSGSFLGGLLPILLIFGIFYFLLFMPMQRQKKQQQRMLTELKNGDVVVTTGGIVGSIVKLDEERIVVRVKPDNVKLELARSSVASLVKPDAGGASSSNS